VLMAALGRIEKILDRAENDHNARAQKRHDQNHDDGENGQDQGVFDQGLPFPARHAPGKRGEKGFDNGSHLRKRAWDHFKKLHERAGFDNERDIKEIKPISVSARDLREWNCSNL